MTAQSARHSFPVILVQTGLDVDHFAGLDRALGERGIPCDRVFPDQPPVQLTDRTRIVVVTDTQATLNALMVRQARRVGATVVLLMDGLVEYRNTFLNPRSGAQFLRPAPADLIACSGDIDRDVLEALGNRAVATGLPRLRDIRECAPPDRKSVLIATANRPAFSDPERVRLVESLRRLQAKLDFMRIPAAWRLTGGLDRDLGVEPDRRPLAKALAACAAVVTTPSTLMVEAMLAGRPTALLHANPTPLWQPAVLGWRGGHPVSLSGPDWSGAAELDAAALDRLREEHERSQAMTEWVSDPADLIERLLNADEAAMQRQAQALRCLHAGSAPADSLADTIASLATDPTRSVAPATRSFSSPARLPAHRPRAARPRVVSCVVCDESVVGGVRTWSQRLAREFARLDLGFDARTLLIAAKPDAWRGADVQPPLDDLTDLCVIDPAADHTETLHLVRQSLERLEPDIILPNYTDLTYAAAAQLLPSGIRTVAIAHTDEPYYRDMIATYNRWSAAIGVSRACADWLGPIEADTRRDGPARPIAQITYGVPIASCPRTVSAAGPLRLAYIGRMVQAQKRIDDLLGVIDGLERRGVAFELHMVGDGPNLAAWRRSLEGRVLRHGRVAIHGARDPGWVEAFLPTIDASLLVSEFEGTSISMLEAMGAGVVPVVTAVSSGVDEWIRDGENGVVVPVGEPDAMAQRLAALARARDLLASLGRAAWEKARRDASIEKMAWQYSELFTQVLAAPADTRPTDLGLRLTEYWRWSKSWAEDPDRALHRIETHLREAGYSKIVHDQAVRGCDAVIIRSETARDPVQAERARRWRERGVAVVFAPHLLEPGYADADRLRAEAACERMRRLVSEAVAAGCRRIAVYGAGKHTRRIAALFTMGLPLVGIMDDRPPACDYMFGVPVVPFDCAMSDLRPDAILLSSDAFEEQMWRRCEEMRSMGVRVIPVYGEYEPAAAAA